VNPYLLMVVLYLSLAVLAALDASLASFGLLPWFNGLRWLRVHFITLGTLVQVAFGLLPVVAARAGQPRPAMRWDIWATLNAGILALLVGIPIRHAPAILAGGTLVAIAAGLLLRQLWDMRPGQSQLTASAGRPFYLAALAFLLVGILAGTGLWLGWGEWLHMAVPKEVHLHANLWGFTSLAFAGLLVDAYPHFAGRPLAWPRATPAILWMLIAAGSALILGPWLGLNALTFPGLALHHLATAWLLAKVVWPLIGQAAAWTPGLWHLVAGYGLILVPVLALPVIRLSGVALPPLAGLEAGAPSVLVYGWVLQLLYALFPYLLARLWPGTTAAGLGGGWFSLLAINLGVLLFVGGMLHAGLAAGLQGAGYALWAASLLPAVSRLGRVLRLARPGPPDS
jgi:hypothetical protein